MGLNIFSCKKQQQEYYFYGTKEYLEKEQSLSINTEQAALIFVKNYFQDNPSEKQVTVSLDIIYNDCYIFSNHWFLSNPKTGDYFLEKSYWINGKTKEIKKIDNEKLNLLIKTPMERFEKKFEK